MARIDYASAIGAFVAHGVHVRFVSLRDYREMDAENSWLRSLARERSRSGFASGVLPLCRQTQRICLAWRSRHVQNGECWGTIGGSAPGTQSLRESAIRELREETGYLSEIDLYPAYVFTRERFQYHNFVGVVPMEFALSPRAAGRWETVKIAWRDPGEWRQMMETDPGSFHKGVIEMFCYSGKLIDRLMK